MLWARSDYCSFLNTLGMTFLETGQTLAPRWWRYKHYEENSQRSIGWHARWSSTWRRTSAYGARKLIARKRACITIGEAEYAGDAAHRRSSAIPTTNDIDG